MGYLHISNLYADQTILLFKECWGLEKADGTSTHISWKEGKISYFPGGCKMETFLAALDTENLPKLFEELGHNEVVIFGEAYGGSIQKRSYLYGKTTKFVAFEVKIGDYWLKVPDAADVASKLKLDFVPYEKVSTDLESLTKLRDTPSRLAERNGCGSDKVSEGLVLRPLEEFRRSNGDRVIVKYKTEQFSERSSKQDSKPTKDSSSSAGKETDSICLEWVTDHRLDHVLDHIKRDTNQQSLSVKDTGLVIKAMQEDVERESKNEIEWSKEISRAVGDAARKLFHSRVKKIEEK